jgi:hypothetical protein
LGSLGQACGGDRHGARAITSKKIDGLLPGSLLAAVEFPQIETVALENPATGHPAVFDDAPVKVLFAILVAFLQRRNMTCT